MEYNNRPQYNNNKNYKKKSYNNSGSGSNGGTAKLTTTKKDGCILVITLNNQNLVLKGFWGKNNEWKLFPYYDKTKVNPSFNQPKPSYQPRQEMDDELPAHMQEFQNSPAPDPTEFNPDQLED